MLIFAFDISGIEKDIIVLNKFKSVIVFVVLVCFFKHHILLPLLY